MKFPTHYFAWGTVATIWLTGVTWPFFVSWEAETPAETAFSVLAVWALIFCFPLWCGGASLSRLRRHWKPPLILEMALVFGWAWLGWRLCALVLGASESGTDGWTKMPWIGGIGGILTYSAGYILWRKTARCEQNPQPKGFPIPSIDLTFLAQAMKAVMSCAEERPKLALRMLQECQRVLAHIQNATGHRWTPWQNEWAAIQARIALERALEPDFSMEEEVLGELACRTPALWAYTLLDGAIRCTRRRQPPAALKLRVQQVLDKLRVVVSVNGANLQILDEDPCLDELARLVAATPGAALRDWEHQGTHVELIFVAMFDSPDETAP